MVVVVVVVAVVVVLLLLLLLLLRNAPVCLRGFVVGGGFYAGPRNAVVYRVLVFTCKNSSFQVGNLGGKLLVISRILTVQRMAMCCGPVCLQPWMPCTGAWFRHGCFGQRMLSEQERYYGLGMDALVSVCSRNTNVIMV